MKRSRFLSRTSALALLLATVGGGAAYLTGTRRASAQSTEANITRLTTSILARSQFAHHPLDRELAGKFLESYLDTLDGSHALFLEPEVQRLARSSGELAESMLRSGRSDLAAEIWKAYVRRLEDRAVYVNSLLDSGDFDFTGHDSYSFDRSHAPRPQTMEAAHTLWRNRLRAEYLEEKLHDAAAEEITRSLRRRYGRELKNAQGLQEREVMDRVLDSLARVYDPHSEYLDHGEMENLAVSMNLSLVGIGATLESDDGYATVRDLVPGGPASKSPLAPGDRIVAVAQEGKPPVDIVNMPLGKAVQLIRGPKGTKVTLTVLPAQGMSGSRPDKIDIIRDEVRLEELGAKAFTFVVPGEDGQAHKLAVIELPSFYSGTSTRDGRPARSVTEDVTRLLVALKAQHVEGLVLDLRANGGGSLAEAISLTGLFIPDGPIVQTRSAGGDLQVATDPDPATRYGGPLVVLTSRFSASASEILAGALQDYGRALIVGDTTTYGKGTVQNILPLARIMDQNQLRYTYDPGALKVTVQKFYRPSGASTQQRGVASDLVLPSVTDVADFSEAEQESALPWDTVSPVAHVRRDRVTAYLPQLKARSEKRVESSELFQHVKVEAARIRGELARKRVSLNEAERRKQLDEDQARKKAFETYLEQHPLPSYARVELSLSDASRTRRNVQPTPATGPASPEAEKDRAHAGAGGHGKPRHSDVTLDETLHILSDYVGLTHLPAGEMASRKVPTESRSN